MRAAAALSRSRVSTIQRLRLGSNVRRQNARSSHSGAGQTVRGNSLGGLKYKFGRDVLAAAAAGAAAGTCVVVAACEGAEGTDAVEEQKTVAEGNYYGIFISKESIDLLGKEFGEKFAATRAEVGAKIASADAPDEVKKLCGVQVDMEVVGSVECDACSILLVKTQGESGIELDNPHIVVRSQKGDDVFDERLLKALEQAGKASLLRGDAHGGIYEWHGKLSQLPSAGVVSVRRYDNPKSHQGQKSNSPVIIKGTMCSRLFWESGANKCHEEGGEKPRCGFCVFMESGPCGEEFKAWEKCVEDCGKDENVDFVEVCAPQTMRLKECVDANEHYYGVLNGKQEEGEEEEKKEEAS